MQGTKQNLTIRANLSLTDGLRQARSRGRLLWLREGQGVKEQSDAMLLHAASWDFELCRPRSKSWPIVRI